MDQPDVTQPQPPLPVGPEPTLGQPPSRPAIDLTALFMILAAGLLVGTIVQQGKLDYCPNDASRWNTIYYLVKHGTYEYLPEYRVSWTGGRGKTLDQLTPEQRLIAELPADRKDTWFKIGERYYQKPWEIPPFWTIDLVRVVGEDGRERYYSSKPPLLATCVAGVVWLIEKLTLGRADFAETPWFIIRTTLIIVHVIPFLVLVWILRGYIHRATDSCFVRSFCLAAVALGTYLTPWSITLNNHVAAAFMALLAVHSAVRIWYDGRREWYWFALAGFCAAFTACLELPAGLLAVALCAALLVKDWKRTVTIGLLAAAVPAVAGLLTNYLAIGRLKPAYMDFGKPGGFYDYPGSYWNQMDGLDALAEPKLVYLMHIVIGHHGFFLLTPILLLALAGIVVHLVRSGQSHRLLAGFVLLLTAALAAVYTRSTNNYGGTSQGARWLFWVIPLWLLFLPDGVRLLAGSRIGRAVCYGFLAVSMVSVAFALRTPWADSWAHLLFRQLKWINY